MKKKRSKVRKPSQEELALLAKVKQQLEELKKPGLKKRYKKAIRDQRLQHYFPTVEEYMALDPYWLSTMTGKFAGRVLGDGKKNSNGDSL